jgi:FkbM family methyltransferase
VAREIAGNHYLKWIVSHPRSSDEIIWHEIFKDHCYLSKYTLKPGDVVVDAGAHIGMFTLYAAEKVGSEGAVYSFEPELGNFSILKEFVEKYGKGIVILDDSGLYSSVGERKFSIQDNNSGGHSFYWGGARETTVRTKTLDSLELQKLNFLKMDVEGSEAEILKGGLETIQRLRPHIGMEVHANELFLEVGSILKPLGYKIGPPGNTRWNCFATP